METCGNRSRHCRLEARSNLLLIVLIKSIKIKNKEKYFQYLKIHIECKRPKLERVNMTETIKSIYVAIKNIIHITKEIESDQLPCTVVVHYNTVPHQRVPVVIA